MKIDPALSALRSDPALQRRSHQTMADAKAAFEQRSDVAAVLLELARYGEGALLVDCPGLLGLFDIGENGLARSEALVSALFADLGAAMRAAPLAQVPFRHQYSGGSALLQLAQAGRAVLSLALVEGAALHRRPAAQSVCFSSGERREMVLAGEGTGRIVRLGGCIGEKAELTCEEAQFTPGQSFALDGVQETKIIDSVPARLVTLRLGRLPAKAEPSREYSLSDGALIHQASGDQRSSRHELALATLGAMARADAAPIMAEIAREKAGDHLRWQALRECLALDSAEGFSALCEIAGRADDGLAIPASAMRAQLLETYPVLAQMEVEPCPA